MSTNHWCHDVFSTSIVCIQSVVNMLTSLSFFPQPVTSSIWTLWKQSPWRAPRPLPRQQMPHWVVARVLLPQSSSSKWHHRVSRWPTTSAGKRFPRGFLFLENYLHYFGISLHVCLLLEFSSGDITQWTVWPSAASIQRTGGGKLRRKRHVWVL